MHKLIIVPFLLLFSLISAQTDNYDKAVELFREAGQSEARYDYETAVKKYEQAADLFLASDYTGNYLQCRILQSINLTALNQFDKAAEILSKTEKTAKKHFGEENRYLVLTYYAAGRAEFGRGQTHKALEYYRKSGELVGKFPVNDPFFTAKLYAVLGNVYADMGNYTKARSYFLKDLNTRLEIAGKQAPQLAAAYTNLSIAERSLGNYSKADEYLDKGLEYVHAAGQEQGPTAALLYSGKGSLYYTMRQYNTALEYMDKALKIKKNFWGKDHASIADEYNNLGLVHKALKNYNKAIQNFRSAYQIQKQVLGSTHPSVAMTAGNFASVLRADEKYESAKIYYREAINILKQNYGEKHPEIAHYYYNLASIHSSTEEHKKAGEYFSKAESLYLSLEDKRHPALSLTYIGMAEARRNNQEYDTALVYYRKALQANLTNFEPDSADLFSNPQPKEFIDFNNLLFALSGKARTLTEIYSQDSTRQHARAAYRTYLLLDSLMVAGKTDIRDESDKLISGNRNRDIYEEAVAASANMSYIAESDEKKMHYTEKAFYFSEKNKAALLSDAVYAADAKQFAGIPDSLVQKQQFLDGQISELKTQILQSADDDKRGQLNETLFKLKREAEQLTDFIQKKYPEYAQITHAQKDVQLSGIQKYLKDGQVLRSYFFGSSQLIIFTLSSRDIKVTSREIPLNFDKQIKQFREYITSGLKSDLTMYLTEGLSLYQLLFPGDLPADTRDLIIVPDRSLGIIPFEALTTQNFTGDIMQFSEYPFLIKKYRMSYFYSAALFAQAAENNQKPKKINNWLGLAPVFSDIDSQSMKGFPLTELPGTLTEVENIYKMVADTIGLYKKVTGSRLSKSYFENIKLQDYDIIHIATHGVVNTKKPELSGLIFYPENNNSDNVLYAGEIYNLQTNADLVVLSACETGLGKISQSEGIIGLTRSFIYAGAKNIVVSLWMVEDASTAELMQNFYRRIMSGKSYAKALHEAKIQLIDSGEKYAHPFFWSPFVLIGR